MKLPRLPRLSLLTRNTPPSRPASTATIPTSEQARVNQTLTLPDGRTLGFAEYGNPNGTPIVFFHGYPSSRLEAWAIHDLAQPRGLRIISPDRPGFGLSTFQPHRRITDWVADVRALTDHLGLPRYAVLGCSGGGPYAVACAHALPHGTMTAVGVFAGGGPWTAGTEGIGLTRRLTSLASVRAPGALETTFDGIVGSLRWLADTGPMARAVENWLAKNEKAGERDRMPVSERRERIMGMIFEAFAQGSAATVQEARLLSHDWGIDFADVTYDKVQIWHGTKDVNSPIRLTRWMADQMPHAELREFDDDHYSLGNRLDVALDDMAAVIRAKEAGDP